MRITTIGLIMVLVLTSASTPRSSACACRRLSVDIDIDWLASHQTPEKGFWAPDHREQCLGKICSGPGSPAAAPANTGLAMLYLLGAGYTHQVGLYRKNLGNAIKYLRRIQTPDGCIGAKRGPYQFGHACCTLALVEAYSLSGSRLLLRRVERAVAWLVRTQNRHPGTTLRTAWGESPGDAEHLAVTVWTLLALRNARAAGIEIPDDAFTGARTWLLARIDPSTGWVSPDAEPPSGQLPKSSVPARIAMASFAMIVAGENPQTSRLLSAAARSLSRQLDRIRDERGRATDDLAWHFGTLVQFHVGGERWRAWSRAMKTAVIDTVRGTDCFEASWPPRGTWASFGGRVHTYALLGMSRQVYFRYGKTVGVRDPGLLP